MPLTCSHKYWKTTQDIATGHSQDQHLCICALGSERPTIAHARLNFIRTYSSPTSVVLYSTKGALSQSNEWDATDGR